MRSIKADSRYTSGRSGNWRSRLAHLGVLILSAVPAEALAAYYVGGDAIGPNNSTTNNTGGFTAVQQGTENLGQPAIEVSLTGQELLTEFRAIVFGLPSAEGKLYFDEFDYRLDVWQRSGYFAGSSPLFQVDLGQPTGVTLVQAGADRVVPATSFGTAGAAGGNAATYDFRFDLTQLPGSSPLHDPLASGDWVFGFQSHHDTEANGVLRVTGANATQGPLPLFSRDNLVPRGILGGQNPNNISLYWGISLAAVPQNLSGDFNGDGAVDTADYLIWRRHLGAASESLLHNNGDGKNGVDLGDYEIWQENFGRVRNPPKYLGGDFNGDGSVDLADYVLWRRHRGKANEAFLNNNGDGMNGVDLGDYNLWRRNFGLLDPSHGSLRGDFNGDGTVNAADYVVWRRHFGAANESALNNNGDGLNGVDVGDFLLWRQRFSATKAPGQLTVANVAEPSDAILSVIASIGLCIRKRRTPRKSRVQCNAGDDIAAKT